MTFNISHINSVDPTVEVPIITKGVLTETSDFTNKTVDDLSNPHIMKSTVTGAMAFPDSSSFSEVRQIDYDRIATDGQRYVGQTGSSGNFVQTLFQINIFEIAKRKNKIVRDDMHPTDFKNIIKSITPKIVGYGRGAGDNQFKDELIFYLWNPHTTSWVKIGENLTNEPEEISTKITNASNYLTGEMPGKYIYLSTSVPAADSSRQSYTYIYDFDIEVEFEGQTDIVHSIGLRTDKPITNVTEPASQISLLKGIIKQLQDGTPVEFDLNQVLDGSTDSLRTKIVNAVEVLEPHAFQLVEELMPMGTRRESPEPFYKTPPKGAKGVMIEAYIDTATGNFGENEGLFLNVNGFISEYSKMNLTLQTKAETSNNKKVTVIWYPGIDNLGDIDNSDNSVYLMPIPLPNKIYIENKITGTFSDTQGIRSSLSLEWLV